jgi:hypothetical protein
MLPPTRDEDGGDDYDGYDEVGRFFSRFEFSSSSSSKSEPFSSTPPPPALLDLSSSPLLDLRDAQWLSSNEL